MTQDTVYVTWPDEFLESRKSTVCGNMFMSDSVVVAILMQRVV